MTNAKGYEITSELDQLAKQVIARYHLHLAGAKIACLYRLGPWKEKGFDQIGRAVMAPPAWRALTGYDVLVAIHKTSYLKIGNKAGDKGRLALLDYAFSYLSETRGSDSCGRPVFQSQGHDIREFSWVVNRHGVCFSKLLALADGDHGEVQLSLESFALEIEQAAEEAAAAAAAEAAAEEMAGSGESGEELEPFCTLEDGDGRSPDDVEVVKSFEFNQ
jgi:hypothetical protein